MTKEEILKYNGMIAKFMCVDESIPHDHQGYYLYDKSMDWLLPVINKIRFYEQVSITSDNSQWECAIETPGYHYATQAFEVDSDLISCVWRACVEYINKVNTNTLIISKK